MALHFYEKNPTLQEPLVLFISVGVLGGFTTFSAFGVDTVALFRAENYTYAAINIFSNVAFGLGAVILGRSIFR